MIMHGFILVYGLDVEGLFILSMQPAVTSLIFQLHCTETYKIMEKLPSRKHNQTRQLAVM
jgi:hypothetical protein